MRLDRLNSSQFDRFRRFIYENSGIHVDINKVTLLSNRIRRRVVSAGFEDYDSYYRFLTSREGRNELSSFLDAVTTNETFFFRSPSHFRWLTDQWLPEQIARHRAGKRDNRLRLWSAGCSSGAEAYSIAICLAENQFRLRGWQLNVLGTDISDEMISVARSGRFNERAIRSVSDQKKLRYFKHDPETNLWQIVPSIRERVAFERHNLMQPMRGARFDCIFICNVLIYFDPASKRRVVQNLLQGLDEGGYLVVGPSEGIYEMTRHMHRISPLIYQKPASKSPVENPARGLGDSR